VKLEILQNHETVRTAPVPEAEALVDVRHLNLFYGDKQALFDISVRFPKNQVTAIIGPSGCGKSTLLRSLNRMNDLIPGVRVTGEVLYEGVNIYDPRVDPVAVRRHIGMVFQKPNPFPKTIFENVALRPAPHGGKGERAGGPGGGGPEAGGPLGGGEGGLQETKRPAALRRPATAPLHRPGHRRGAPPSSSWTSPPAPWTPSPPRPLRT
jgi:hypothetical protein